MEITDMSFTPAADERNKPMLVVADFSRVNAEALNIDFPIAEAGSFNSIEDILRICNGDRAKAQALLKALEDSDRVRIRQNDLDRKNNPTQEISQGERTN